MTSRLKIAKDKYGLSNDEILEISKFSGKNHKYIDFVCKAYVDDDFYNGEYDFPEIGDAVSTFEKFKSKLEQKDLNKYTIASLNEAISKLSISRKDLKNKDINVLYEDDTWKVVHPLSFESSQLYCAGTKWCTSRSSTYKDYNQLTLNKKSVQYYLLIIIVNKLTNKKIGGSFYGTIDSPNDNSHYISLYDELDDMFFSLSKEQRDKYSLMLNSIFSNVCETKSKPSQEDFSNLIFANSVLPFVKVKEQINLIYNQFISYLCDIFYELKFNFDLDNKCYNLVQNKSSLLTRVYSLESAHKALQALKKHFSSEIESFDHIMKLHDNKCKFFEISKKIKTKAAKNNFDFKLLESCSCNKFNNILFLQELKKSIDKTICETKALEDRKIKILSVIEKKIKFLDDFNKNRGVYMENLLKKDTKDINVELIIDKLNLSRDEALFLQVKSESSNVKNYCKSAYNIPDDFAKELLALKNINNLSDLKV